MHKLKTIPQVKAPRRVYLPAESSRSEDNSAGVQVIGIDPASAANQFPRGNDRGEFLTPDDREGILIGKPLAEKFNLKVGDQVSLLVNKSEGDVDEQTVYRARHLHHQHDRLR